MMGCRTHSSGFAGAVQSPARTDVVRKSANTAGLVQ